MIRARSRELADATRVRVTAICGAAPMRWGRAWEITAPGASCEHAGSFGSLCDTAEPHERTFGTSGGAQRIELLLEGDVRFDVEVCVR